MSAYWRQKLFPAGVKAGDGAMSVIDVGLLDRPSHGDAGARRRSRGVAGMGHKAFSESVERCWRISQRRCGDFDRLPKARTSRYFRSARKPNSLRERTDTGGSLPPL
jgi:hypothetical protein